MAALFSDEWMKQFKDAWNAEPDVKDKLAELDFSSVICYGFKDDTDPTGFFKVEKGECTSAGSWNGETLNWDLRAGKKDWLKWIDKGIGMPGLGVAYTTGKLKFKEGDYTAMVKDPRMAGPFVKSFGLMQKVGADELG